LYNNVQGAQLFDREEEIGKGAQGWGHRAQCNAAYRVPRTAYRVPRIAYRVSRTAYRVPFFPQILAFLKNPFYNWL